MAHDYEAIVSALQLLLADVPDEDKRAVFYKAFPDSFIILKGDASKLGKSMRETRSYLQTIFDVTDGQTPLGLLAVQQVHRNADWAIRDLSKAAWVLGINIGNMP